MHVDGHVVADLLRHTYLTTEFSICPVWDEELFVMTFNGNDDTTPAKKCGQGHLSTNNRFMILIPTAYE